MITHGGNNTVTEAFHHGKPMIVLPLFWDQVDNAQRIDETGFGRRLATYDFRDDELTDAIDELLADRALKRRLAAIASRLQAEPGDRPRRRPDRARGARPAGPSTSDPPGRSSRRRARRARRPFAPAYDGPTLVRLPVDIKEGSP